ncbi:MAG: ParB/RepB/Spo0J family partition protein [Clostridia bacterium]|nr:ParB/RepB/Spo0J family partition protein [Clostridia bacterium]
MANKIGGLGRGLDSLFSDNSTENDNTITVKINDVEPNRAQPRKDFDETALAELADSIIKHGLIQPIVVRPNPGGGYTIIAGERRWRACRMAGLETVPVVIKDVSEKEVVELALIENLQREDLNPIEEAQGFKTLIDNYNLTQEDVASRVGKSRSAVANAMRLLALKDEETEALKKGFISSGHARALLAIDDEELRKTAFRLSLDGSTVRDIEALSKKSTRRQRTVKPAKNTYFKEVELALKEELGRKTVIKPVGAEGGTITLEFYNKDELSEIVKKLTN